MVWLPVLARRPGRLGVFVALLAGAGALVPGARAESLPPPLELLHAASTVLVVGTLHAGADPGHARLDVATVLHGAAEKDGSVDLRVIAGALRGVDPAVPYLVAYTEQRTDSRHPGRMVLDPLGPQLIVSRGLEPALFRDAPATRALLEGGRSEEARESRSTLRALRAALDGADPQLQNLAVAEFLLDPAVAPRIDAAVRARCAALVAAADTAPRVRLQILSGALGRPERIGADWLQKVLRDMIATLPTAVAGDGLDAVQAELALTALRAADRLDPPLPPSAFERWVDGDSPVLAEAALLQMRQSDPAAEAQALQRALARTDLAPTMRSFLADHERRRALMERQGAAH